MERCSLERPNRRQNQCISHHCHRGQNGDDDGACQGNNIGVRSEFRVTLINEIRDRVITRRRASRLVEHGFRFVSERQKMIRFAGCL